MDHDRLEPISDEATLLERVARRRREIVLRRRLVQGAAGVLSLVLVTFAAVTVLGSGADEHPVSGVVDQERSTDPTPSPSGDAASSPDESPAPQATRAPTGESCRNSLDPACGPFYWDPEPDPGEPMRLNIEQAPAEPAVGSEVTFTVYMTDDAMTYAMVTEGWFGEGGSGFGVSPVCPAAEERFGPWTPPERRVRTRQETYTHTYEAAGTYEVTFKASTNYCNAAGYDPYASEATESIRITVRGPSPNPLPL